MELPGGQGGPRVVEAGVGCGWVGQLAGGPGTAARGLGLGAPGGWLASGRLASEAWVWEGAFWPWVSVAASHVGVGTPPSPLSCRMQLAVTPSLMPLRPAL